LFSVSFDSHCVSLEAGAKVINSFNSHKLFFKII
jgi:hypothetical protein